MLPLAMNPARRRREAVSPAHRGRWCALATFVVLATTWMDPCQALGQQQVQTRTAPGQRQQTAVDTMPSPGEITAADQPEESSLTLEMPEGWTTGPEVWTSPEGLVSTLQVMILLTVLTLAPAILIMTTSFVRVVVVLSLLRQAIGTQQLPPSQVITALSLFITVLVMMPTWNEVYNDAIDPYTSQEISLQEATKRAVAPIHRFMAMQIDRTGNYDDVYLFLKYLPDQPQPETLDDVPLTAMVPAFMLSELKTAFLIGFQIYLPFLIMDMVIASVMVSMGMLMLPPVLISLPFKLMLFVLLDGWHLVVSMLLDSFWLYV